MKLTIATLLLSPVFASKAAKYGKFSKVKGKAAKSGYRSSMSMSASMSIGPPPITLTACGESFTDEKVVLTNDLDCSLVEGERIGDCAVTLDGPDAEINCDGNTLSQVASSPFYDDGPYKYGICLNNGAKARNCISQQFRNGILVENGGEVSNSFLSSNYRGIIASFYVDSTLTIDNTEASNNGNTGLAIDVDGVGVEAKLNMKGKVTLNENGFYGMYPFLNINTNLEINVKRDATLETCGNNRYDIYVSTEGGDTATFLGTGYTCDETKVASVGPGIVVKPVCQEACSST